MANWPVEVDLEIFQGSTYEHRFQVQLDEAAFPLTGYTARMQIRIRVADDTAVYDVTTDDADLTIDGANGYVDLLIHGDTSEAWTFTKGFYDIEVVSASDVPYRIAKGEVTVDPEVTR